MDGKSVKSCVAYLTKIYHTDDTVVNALGRWFIRKIYINAPSNKASVYRLNI